MERDEIVKYWLESSDDDYQVMQSLFDNGHYAWALFLSHLVIEKLLKACYVKYVDVNYPRIHNLVEIAVKAKLRSLGGTTGDPGGVDNVQSQDQVS